MDFWATEYMKIAMPVVAPGRTSVPGALGARAFGAAAGAGGLMAANHAMGQPMISQALADKIYAAPGQAADAVSGAAHNGMNSFRNLFGGQSSAPAAAAPAQEMLPDPGMPEALGGVAPHFDPSFLDPTQFLM